MAMERERAINDAQSVTYGASLLSTKTGRNRDETERDEPLYVQSKQTGRRQDKPFSLGFNVPCAAWKGLRSDPTGKDPFCARWRSFECPDRGHLFNMRTAAACEQQLLVTHRTAD